MTYLKRTPSQDQIFSHKPSDTRVFWNVFLNPQFSIEAGFTLVHCCGCWDEYWFTSWDPNKFFTFGYVTAERRIVDSSLASFNCCTREVNPCPSQIQLLAPTFRVLDFPLHVNCYWNVVGFICTSISWYLSKETATVLIVLQGATSIIDFTFGG